MVGERPDLRYRYPLGVRILIILALLLVPAYYALMLILGLCFVALGIGPLVASAYILVNSPILFRVAGVVGICGVFSFLGALALARAVVLSFRTPAALEPAIWINKNRETALTALIDEMCAIMGARKPDAVILQVGTDCFVAQRELTVLNANPRGRILCLGLGLLGCLNIRELRAVIAHEFAHFIGGDLLYSAIVLRAFVGIDATGRALVDVYDRSGRLARLFSYIPFRLCILIMGLFFYTLLRIDRRVNRARELRADALAARVCGTLALSDALRKSHAYGLMFNTAVFHIEEKRQAARKLDANILRLWRKNLQNLAPDAQRILEDVLAQPTDKFDSHPSLRERIDSLPPVPNRFDDAQPSLSLIKELAKYEKMAGDFLANEHQLAKRYEQRGF